MSKTKSTAELEAENGKLRAALDAAKRLVRIHTVAEAREYIRQIEVWANALEALEPLPLSPFEAWLATDPY